MNAHVRRYHQHYHTQGTGHIWQGRFKAFPAQADEHLLLMLRSVERNPLRAKLVKRALDWPWSSLKAAMSRRPPTMLHPGPMPRPTDWLRRVRQAETAAELEALHRSVNKGTPLGSERWVKRTATRLELTHTLRDRGRPKKKRRRRAA